MQSGPQRRLFASDARRPADDRDAVQTLLCHSKIESTVSYLGDDVDDALKLAERTEV